MRPSKTIDMAFGLIGFTGEYGDGNGLLGTIGSPPMRLEAQTWTRMAISSGEQEAQGTTLVVSVMGDGVAWAAGDTLEVRNLKVVKGSALP
ncbi:hypothetical protein [Croceibacterium ferulae]|uniref:hypothetical protein n=1 Tax=Croceibacterium ferulae TaxID=1854641 RepID=UPI000F89AF7C|nr:hypothetical protein [Croceibacterium ferulae]